MYYHSHLDSKTAIARFSLNTLFRALCNVPTLFRHANKKVFLSDELRKFIARCKQSHWRKNRVPITDKSNIGHLKTTTRQVANDNRNTSELCFCRCENIVSSEERCVFRRKLHTLQAPHTVRSRCLSVYSPSLR